MEPSAPLSLVLLLGILAASSNLAGGVLALVRPALTARRQVLALAFSGGFLLSVAVLNIMPESISAHPQAPVLILAGYLLVYLSEHLFAGHAHQPHVVSRGGHALIGVLPCGGERMPIRSGAAAAASAGLLLHSLFDGAAITAALSAGTTLGWLTFFAVFLHKMPEGFSLATITIASRRGRGAALGMAGALGAASLAGSLLVLAAGSAFRNLEGLVLAVACGMFLHISATDLLPTTAHVKGVRVLAATVAGFVTAVAASALLHGILRH